MLPIKISSTLKAGVVLSFKKGFFISFGLFVIKKYIFDDWQFMGFLCVLLMLDASAAVVGRLKNRLEGKPNPKFPLFFEILIKMYIYFSVLIMTHVLISFTVRGITNIIFSWFDTFTYSVIIAHEALSIFRRLDFIDPRLLPPILRRPLDKVLTAGPVAAAGILASVADPLRQPGEPAVALNPLPAVLPASPSNEAED